MKCRLYEGKGWNWETNQEAAVKSTEGSHVDSGVIAVEKVKEIR